MSASQAAAEDAALVNVTFEGKPCAVPAGKTVAAALLGDVYNETIRYVDRTLADNADLLEVYRVCIPFKVSTCTSMFQRFWRPWEDN